MYHIYIYTPFHKNGNYITHINEHCVMNIKSEKNYFEYNDYIASCSTFCTYFILPTKSKKILDKFINRIKSTPTNEIIKYEHSVIKDENNDFDFEKDLITKIGKKLYGNNYNYTQNGRLSYNIIKNYHKKYYQDNNIIILENDIKYFAGKIINKFNLTNILKIKNETVLIFKHSLISFFSLIIISKIIDDYTYYNIRYKNKKYYSNSTIYGNFENHIYISINKNSINLYKSINKNFINQYIKYSLKNKKYLDDKYFDGSNMIKYGYTLSNNDKTNILKNTCSYYKQFVNIHN